MIEIKHKITGKVIYKFEGTDLTGTNLRWANLTGTDLTGTDLRGTNLRWANLTGTDLTGTDLRGTNLRWTNLRGTNLTGADLTGTDLRGATGTFIFNFGIKLKVMKGDER